MSKKIIKESFPGQPEDKDIVTGVSAPFKQANKEHDENVKNAEEAMDANKEAVDLVYGDNTKKKEGNFKNDALKKMHLSENLFKSNFDEDYGYNEEDRIAEIIDQLQYALDDVMEDACGEGEIDKSKRISRSALMKGISNLFSQASNRYYFTESYKNNKLVESFKVTNIDWCVEVGEDVDTEEEKQEVINSLPTEVNVPDDVVEEDDPDEIIDELVADYLSDKFGWLVNSFSIENKDLDEEVELNEDTDNVFDKIAKKLAPSMGVSEDLKKNK